MPTLGANFKGVPKHYVVKIKYNFKAIFFFHSDPKSQHLLGELLKAIFFKIKMNVKEIHDEQNIKI